MSYCIIAIVHCLNILYNVFAAWGKTIMNKKSMNHIEGGED